MHYLLLPYSLIALSLLFTVGNRTREARSLLAFFGWLAFGTAMYAVVFRDIGGDTSRYYRQFVFIGQSSLSQLISSNDNFLFLLFNWLLAQVSDHVRMMTAAVALVSAWALYIGLRRLFSAYHTAALLFVYSMYPFFIFYVSSGLKQAIAMGLLFLAYTDIFRGRRMGYFWAGLAPLFHFGAAAALPFLALHLILYRQGFGYRRALKIMGLLLAGSIGLAITGLNESLMAPVQSLLGLGGRYEIYFMDASEFDYRAGFRLDFTLFSLLPLFAAAAFARLGYRMNSQSGGWWLSLYLSLCIIYQLFAFAPFADRFAGFSWYIMPAVAALLCFETGSRRIQAAFIAAFVVVNVLLLQFYTGVSHI